MRKVIQPIVANVAGAAVAVTLATPVAAEQPRHTAIASAAVTVGSLQRPAATSGQAQVKKRRPRFDLVLEQAQWRQDVVVALRSKARAKQPFVSQERSRQHWF